MDGVQSAPLVRLDQALAFVADVVLLVVAEETPPAGLHQVGRMKERQGQGEKDGSDAVHYIVSTSRRIRVL
jgi:hypothetical protein